MENKRELKDFIQDNRYLLTAMGVFGGLTALFQRLENASYLVLISFIMFILVGFETYAQFWKNKVKKTLRLLIFENLTITLIIAVSLHFCFLLFINHIFSICNN
jgi:hypothetical protein